MTPKEKAAEMIVNYQLKCESLDYEEAKLCALIAVNEVIEALDCNQWQNKSMIDWYNQVKQEIYNL